MDYSGVLKGVLQAILVAAILWLGGQVGDLINAVRDNTDSVNQIFAWASQHEEGHE